MRKKTEHVNYNKPPFHHQEDCTNQWVSCQLSLNTHWLVKSACSPGSHGGQTREKDERPSAHSASSVEDNKMGIPYQIKLN